MEYSMLIQITARENDAATYYGVNRNENTFFFNVRECDALQYCRPN